MRIKKVKSVIHEGDLTPMIDMTFQLIAFFMVLINFTQSEQDQRIQLPESTLAKPPEAPLEFPITLHLLPDGQVVIGGNTDPDHRAGALPCQRGQRAAAEEQGALRRHGHHPRTQGRRHGQGSRADQGLSGEPLRPVCPAR